MQRTSSPVTELAVLEVPVDLGQRVMVVADIHLDMTGDRANIASCNELVTRLDDWRGPGLVIVAGNLFAQSPEDPQALVATHTGAFDALQRFTGAPDRRCIVLPGWRDAEVLLNDTVRSALEASGVELASSVDLSCRTTTGIERVRVAAGSPLHAVTLDAITTDALPSLEDVRRLEDPERLESFVTSRVLYRRLGRWLWFPPTLAALLIALISFTPIFQSIDRIVLRSNGVDHVISRVRDVPWTTRLAFLIAVIVVTEIVVGLTARGIALRLTKRELHALDRTEASTALTVAGEPPLDLARRLINEGYRGLILGGNLAPQLRHRDDAFYAVVGGLTEVVQSRPTRAGLPSVYTNVRQVSWVELETGWGLTVRLVAGWTDLPGATTLERLAVRRPIVKGYKATAEILPRIIASWPNGGTWPQATDPAARRRRTRRVRRIVAAAVFITGLLDLLVAVSPPLRGRLQTINQFLPLGVAQAAGALVALTGIVLMMLARGVLRGQWRPWLLASLLLAASTILHVVHAVSFGAVVLSAGVLLLSLTEWRNFRGETDRISSRSAFGVLLFGGVASLIIAFLVAELTSVHGSLPPPGTVLLGLLERFAGITNIALPDRVNDWVTPVLTVIGVVIALAALYLITRPVVDRRRAGDNTPTRLAEMEKARDIVARHGRGTLDYFALRDDKQFFFSQDSLVAYAVFGGICIASPDPIGPPAERQRVIEDFWAFADSKGWGFGVVGAAEEWLPIYIAAGMRSVYIGDEAVVDLQHFSLAGNKMKGLRQAASRVERQGYTVEFLDPALATSAQIAELSPLLTASRRGDEEKGFSMMLGRMFMNEDRGLLLTIVRGPAGAPAAMCQFVPSAAISGYSLDLMRRDSGEHPNGLLDFALCQTIAHLRDQGGKGLSLNFAVLRSALAADGEITLTQRIERWFLLELSGYLQIESLWKFNSKYEPTWQPRYIVYDSPEQFLPSVISFLRAESVSDVPVIGKLFTSKKRSASIVLGSGEPSPLS